MSQERIVNAIESMINSITAAAVEAVKDAAASQLPTSPGRWFPDGDYLMTVDEVAEMTCLLSGTLRQWRYNGKGPESFKLRGRVVYWHSKVLHWIAECELEESQ